MSEKKMGLTPEEQELKERLMRSGESVIRTKGTGKIPEDFWDLPRPKDPEGLALRYLLEDRREGR
ncbi:MAG: hypothetical protein WA990_02185 [Rubrobacteraceae bacterium]